MTQIAKKTLFEKKIKKSSKKIWRFQISFLSLHRNQDDKHTFYVAMLIVIIKQILKGKQIGQTYGVMVTQQILVLLFEVRILIGLQAPH